MYSAGRTRTFRAIAATALATALPLFLTACGDDGGSGGKATAEPSPAATVKTFDCLTEAQAKAGSITFKDTGGNAVDGYLAGTGTAGIVLAHQSDGNVCQWVPKALELVKSGYRVLAIDSNGDEVPEVVAGAQLLRGKGATKLVLMGASKGGTSVLTAAAKVQPPADAVVSLSAPEQYGQMDAAAAVPGLTAPVFYMAADGDTAFADSTKALSKASVKAKENSLYIVTGIHHGVSMLDDAENWAKVTAFLKKYGG
ncbi:alpha/beta hydrolase [Streptomyces sp. SID13666]|uniref:alpha/beta hydrolase family protein n=1 Tax=unclassified Streptomyces TaxID=2593676 RepID=UPI0013BFE4BF|nr:MULTISPECIES: alpha/beta hydrolase [unclassified Streptomyces]NEA57648.1 alpha/beta hydrolase [Streptomyces sp. SID13666]NEA73990.1 alpha/beta hydrolase [Streptomyces sp. SID13588]